MIIIIIITCNNVILKSLVDLFCYHSIFTLGVVDPIILTLKFYNLYRKLPILLQFKKKKIYNSNTDSSYLCTLKILKSMIYGQWRVNFRSHITH